MQLMNKMADSRSSTLCLICLIITTLSGLIGFLVVYNSGGFEEMLKHFAIVIDAGSTHTGSNLYTIGMDVPKMVELTNKTSSGSDNRESAKSGNKQVGAVPLTKLLQVKQVTHCANGGPLAFIKSEGEARELVRKCLPKLSGDVKRLDMDEEVGEDSKAHSGSLSDTVLPQNVLNHQVDENSTHVFLGATAGMRTHQALNPTAAEQKIKWIDKAIVDESKSSSAKNNGPNMQKDFVRIIDGSEEGAFAWTSVNFVCNKLEAKLSRNNENNNGNGSPIGTVGTVELGGSSAQVAYQVPDTLTSKQILDTNLEEKNIELFNGDYRLATRSDLCLGMTQAVLRVNYLVLKNHFDNKSDSSSDIEHPCLTEATQSNLTSLEIKDIVSADCTVPSSTSDTNKFKIWVQRRSAIKFVGTGDTNQCRSIMSNLIVPDLCKKYFTLCLPNNIGQPPPKQMPFVAISAYNKAIQHLNLDKKQSSGSKPKDVVELEETIGEKLGGYSVDHDQLVGETQKFCALHVSELPEKFPKLGKAHYALGCLRLIYVHKLLTDFYLFDPKIRWEQLKFLVFPVDPKPVAPNQEPHELKNDIGWPLGMILNATSYRYKSADQTGLMKKTDSKFHGSNPLFSFARSFLLVMLFCIMITTIFVSIGLIANRYRKEMSSKGIPNV